MGLKKRSMMATCGALALAAAIGLSARWNLFGVGTVSESISPAQSYPLRFAIPSAARRQSVSPLPEPSNASDPSVQISTPLHETPLAAPKPSQVQEGALKGLIPVRFQLTGSADGGGKSSDFIMTRKPLMRNGVTLGEVTIWIDPAGAIAIDSADLSRLLAQADNQVSEGISQSGQDRTTFSSLRARGIAINYDPIADRLLMRD